MISHIVTIVKQRNLMQRPFANERGQDGMVLMHARSMFEQVENYARNNYLDLQTFYFDNEKHAKAFAEYFAQERPGYDIYVAKTQNIVTAEVGPAVVKNISDKGVLPA